MPNFPVHPTTNSPEQSLDFGTCFPFSWSVWEIQQLFPLTELIYMKHEIWTATSTVEACLLSPAAFLLEILKTAPHDRPLCSPCPVPRDGFSKAEEVTFVTPVIDTSLPVLRTQLAPDWQGFQRRCLLPQYLKLEVLEFVPINYITSVTSVVCYTEEVLP